MVAKLVHVQVLEPDRFVEVGQSQRLRTVQLDADRGRILDREGHDLALSVLRPTVFADPSQVEDPLATARALAPVLGMEVAELADVLDRDSRFAYLSRRIDDDVAARIVELDLAGIHLLEEPARFTPSEELARSIIGRVAPDQTGSTGIELLYDEVLTGTPGEMTYERARDGGTIAAAGQTRIAPRSGSDVVLTLDRSLQYEAERVLSAQVDELGAKGGTVIISQPETGEILALANITRNTDDEIITAGANRAAIDVFEPGSVNKVITIAAALEEGLVEPEHGAGRARQPPGVRPPLLRRPRAPDGTDVGHPDHGRVLERGHDHAGPGARQGADRPVPAGLRVRHAVGARLPERVARAAPAHRRTGRAPRSARSRSGRASR